MAARRLSLGALVLFTAGCEVIESEEWQRLQEQQLEELQIQGEVGNDTLPGAFEPNVTPSCLH